MENFALFKVFMGERKPINHYIPWDFDPTKPARRCKPQHGQIQVRWMLPMSIRCTNCGDYMFQGTKANCRKELCYKEFYLGINVYRIYMHCKACYAEITFKTDPKNCDYIIEKGATRHFEPFRKLQVENALDEKRRMLGTKVQEAEEQAVDTQREMDQMRELERLHAISNKEDKANFKEIMKKKQEEGVDSTLTEEDREKIASFEEAKKIELLKRASQTPIQSGMSSFLKPSNNRWTSKEETLIKPFFLHNSSPPPNSSTSTSQNTTSLLGYESDSD